MTTTRAETWIIGSGLGYAYTGTMQNGEYVFSYIPHTGENRQPISHITFAEEYQVQEFLSCLYRQSQKWFIDWNLPGTHLAKHPAFVAIHRYMYALEKRIKQGGRQHVTL